MVSTVTSTEREPLIRRGLRLEYLTVGWNVVEGVIAVGAALAAGSVALLGFGLDSFVESSSGAVLIWRLRAEARLRTTEEVERIDRRAHQFVGISLFILAAYIGVDSIWALWNREMPELSLIGIGLTSVSLVVMLWLAREKRRVGVALGSRALEADSFQTTACWWLSLVVLAGLLLNAVFGWWWADPAAALGITYFLVKEGREAWKGEQDECCS